MTDIDRDRVPHDPDGKRQRREAEEREHLRRREEENRRASERSRQEWAQQTNRGWW